MTKDELIKELGNLAIRFSEGWHEGIKIDASDIMLFNEIAEALAQPEPWEKFCDSNCVWTDHHPDCKLAEHEPVAWTLLLVGEHHGIIGKAGDAFASAPEHYRRVDVYTTPPQRTWVGLRDDEIYSVLENLQVMHHRPPTTDSRVIFAQAIEAKLKEKNT